MPLYVYKAVTDSGLIVKNKVEEESKQAVIEKLKRNKLTPISITEQINFNKNNKKKRNIAEVQEIMKNSNTTNLLNKKEKYKVTKTSTNPLEKLTKDNSRNIIIFTQNFYLLKKANFNNIHALETIIKSTEDPTFRGILEDILAGVEAGENMYTTMEYYSNVFPYIYTNMIKVGELSGSLTNSLEQAVKYLEDSGELERKVKKILIPNIVQIVALIALLIGGTLVAIPSIQDVFESMGATESLPGITLWFQSFLNKVMQYWYIPTFFIIGLIVGIIFYINTPKGKYQFHYFKYTMPLFGKLIFSIDFSRLMKAMLLNLQNGMRIQEALEVSKNVVNNYVMISIVESAINNILLGTSWIEPFENSGLATPMMTEMLKIGMQTDLTEMIEKLLEYMDIDINQLMQKIMSALPQIVYLIVGVLLIFFVVVVLVPCIQVYMGNFLFDAYGV